MRERRHQSGSSNAPRPASAREPPSSDRPTTATPSGPEGGPSRPPRGNSSGFATARLATPTEVVEPKAPRRRIHSARVESSSRIVTPPSVVVPKRDSTPLTNVTMVGLPRLALTQSEGTSNDGVQWAIRVSGEEPDKILEPPSQKESKRSVTTTTTATTTTATIAGAQIPEHLVPVFRDFSALLRDRYEGKRSLRLAFLNWDRDKDGQLSSNEVRDLINTLGFTKRLGRDNAEAIINHVAALPKQSLLYDDFCSYIFGFDDSERNSRAPTLQVHMASKAFPTDVANNPDDVNKASADPAILLSSDRALYPDVDRVVNILRKKYATRQLRQVFRHWDADKDGGINLQELDRNLRRQGIKLPQHQLTELLEKHDRDRDGRLLYREFVEMIYGPVITEHHNPALQAHIREVTKMGNQPPDPYQILRNSALENPVARVDEKAICNAVQQKLRLFAPRLHDAYTAFDDDHNGNLSYLEFREGLSELGLHFTEREFLHLASLTDADGSGEISFREFTNMFSRRIMQDHRAEDGSSEKTDPELLVRQRARLNQGTFDFSHLTRRAKVPTRRGRTPTHHTKDLISDPTLQDPMRFRTETQLYGTGQPQGGRRTVSREPRVPEQAAADKAHTETTTSPPPTVATAVTTLGQETKQRKEANYANRLQRIRQQREAYERQTAPLHESYDQMQQRRVQTLHRHQQRYQQSIEDHRPHQPHYAPAVANHHRHLTMPPYINN